MEYPFLSAHELAWQIREGNVRSVEVLEAHIERINKVNPQLNAIVTLDIDGARRRAAEADAALSRGELWGPLHGVPITIKDSFATAGIRTTSGSKSLANYIPRRDAEVVHRLRQAGAILIGKTNLPTFARQIQTDNPVFGRTNNPWNLACTPGGSTGGGAAAIAAGLSPLELGSDIGGSLRIPAHFCGIYGLKPTGGRVIGPGHISNKQSINNAQPSMPPPGWEALWQLPVFGPLARSVTDLRLALQVIAEPGTPPLQDVPVKPLSELKIAWSDHFGDLPISQATQHVMKALVAKLGIENPQTVHATDVCDINELWEVTGACMGAIDTTFQSPLMQRLRSLAGHVIPTKFITHPIYKGVLAGIRMDHQEVMEFLKRRKQLIDQMETFLDQHDLWILPVFPIPAFTHRHPSQGIEVDGTPVSLLTAGTALNTIFNVTGHPVVVIPAGFSPDGLPIGLQLVGKRWHEMELLSAAETIDCALEGYRRPGEVG